MDVQGEDIVLIHRWFQHLQRCIQTVDFVGSRPLFADDVVTFGTSTAFTVGRDTTQKEQWRNVWGRIDQFRCRLDDLRTIVAGDRLATVVLGRKAVGEEWEAQHTHVSLFPGTPSRSFGTKQENPPAL